MREIKFRAWNTYTKSWSYFDGPFNKIPTKETSSFPQYESIPVSVIDNKTISQFTGLKDKNGKEIYEGDIVELNVEIHKVPKELNRHVVVFRKGAFVCSENGFYFWDYAEGVNDDTVEVIGNIFEHPELLEK